MRTKLTALAPLVMALTLALQGGNALAAGDPAKGENSFKRCAACHALEAGKNKVGPSLHQIVGRQAGTVEGYRYSDSYIQAGEKGLNWGPEELTAYLEDPRKYIRDFLGDPKAKSRMANKFKKLELRQDIVAYLESLQ